MSNLRPHLDGWTPKWLYLKRGNGFCVEVQHYQVTATGDSLFDSGPNRWCVYAYIYPGHPEFGGFEGDEMCQEAALALPLHGGPSFLRWHRCTDGQPMSVQVGADYNHLGDDCGAWDTPERACLVFYDAQQLVDWLTDRAAPQPQTEAEVPS